MRLLLDHVIPQPKPTDLQHQRKIGVLDGLEVWAALPQGYTCWWVRWGAGPWLPSFDSIAVLPTSNVPTEAARWTSPDLRWSAEDAPWVWGEVALLPFIDPVRFGAWNTPELVQRVASLAHGAPFAHYLIGFRDDA